MVRSAARVPAVGQARYGSTGDGHVGDAVRNVTARENPPAIPAGVRARTWNVDDAAESEAVVIDQRPWAATVDPTVDPTAVRGDFRDAPLQNRRACESYDDVPWCGPAARDSR